MGARLLKSWLRYPLIDIEDIKARHQAVEEAKNTIQVRHDIREYLKSVYDIERVGSKIVMGHANARVLVALKRSLLMLPRIQQMQNGMFNTTDVLIDRHPVIHGGFIKHATVKIRTAVPVEIPGRFNERVHGIGFSSGLIVTALGTGCLYKIGKCRQG